MPTTVDLSTENTSRTSPGRRRRRTPYVVAAVAVGGVLAVSGLAAVSSAMTQHDHATFAADGIRELVIHQDSGNVTLVTDPTAGHLQVTTSRNWSWQQPASAHTVKDGVLTVTSTCPDFPGLGACGVDQRVTVPSDVKVQVEVSAGNIDGAGLKLSSFGAHTDSGSIDATNMDVTAFSATTSSGSVHATLSRAPEHATAETSSGNIHLTVPDMPYQVHAGTSAGQVRIDVRDDPTASRSITAHTSSGNVTIARG
jgi:hypothetical protein